MFNRIANYFKPREKFSLEMLQYYYSQLVKNPVINDKNKQHIIEVLRCIAELLIWGDQHNPVFFDFFLEKNILQYFFNILNQKTSPAIKVQLLQTLSILIENITNETSIYYLLSNNHINDIIVFKFDFSNEEVLAYYISFVKTLSLKLNLDTIQFFFNESAQDFPLYTEAVKFFNHEESMICIAVRTLTLNVYRVENEAMRRFILDRSRVPYFSNLVHFIGRQCTEADENIRRCTATKQHLSKIETYLETLLDHMYYLHDIFNLNIDALNSVLSDHLLQDLILPLFVGSIPRDPDQRLRQRISPLFALFLLCQVFSIFTHKPLINSVATALIHPTNRVRFKRSHLNLEPPASKTDMVTAAPKSVAKRAAGEESFESEADPDPAYRNPYRDALFRYLHAQAGDHMVLPTLCLFYSMIKNQVMDHQLLQVADITPQRLRKQKRLFAELTTPGASDTLVSFAAPNPSRLLRGGTRGSVSDYPEGDTDSFISARSEFTAASSRRDAVRPTGHVRSPSMDTWEQSNDGTATPPPGRPRPNAPATVVRREGSLKFARGTGGDGESRSGHVRNKSDGGAIGGRSRVRLGSVAVAQSDHPLAQAELAAPPPRPHRMSAGSAMDAQVITDGLPPRSPALDVNKVGDVIVPSSSSPGSAGYGTPKTATARVSPTALRPAFLTTGTGDTPGEGRVTPEEVARRAYAGEDADSGPAVTMRRGAHFEMQPMRDQPSEGTDGEADFVPPSPTRFRGTPTARVAEEESAESRNARSAPALLPVPALEVFESTATSCASDAAVAESSGDLDRLDSSAALHGAVASAAAGSSVNEPLEGANGPDVAAGSLDAVRPDGANAAVESAQPEGAAAVGQTIPVDDHKRILHGDGNAASAGAAADTVMAKEATNVAAQQNDGRMADIQLSISSESAEDTGAVAHVSLRTALSSAEGPSLEASSVPPAADAERMAATMPVPTRDDLTATPAPAAELSASAPVNAVSAGLGLTVQERDGPDVRAERLGPEATLNATPSLAMSLPVDDAISPRGLLAPTRSVDSTEALYATPTGSDVATSPPDRPPAPFSHQLPTLPPHHRAISPPTSFHHHAPPVPPRHHTHTPPIGSPEISQIALKGSAENTPVAFVTPPTPTPRVRSLPPTGELPGVNGTPRGGPGAPVFAEESGATSPAGDDLLKVSDSEESWNVSVEDEGRFAASHAAAQNTASGSISTDLAQRRSFQSLPTVDGGNDTFVSCNRGDDDVEYSHEVVERLILIMHHAPIVRMVSLQANTELLTAMVFVGDNATHLSAPHASLFKMACAMAAERLRQQMTVMAPDLLLAMFEDEYCHAERPRLEKMMKDPSLLLPPSSSALSGLQLEKRLPSGDSEQTRRAMQTFLEFRRLRTMLCGPRPGDEGLSWLEDVAPLKEGDSINLDGQNVYACMTKSEAGRVHQQYLVVEREEAKGRVLLVEPHATEAGVGVVAFIGALQGTEIVVDSSDTRRLSLRGQPVRTKRKRRTGKEWQQNLTFESPTHARTAKEALESGAADLRASRVAGVERLLGVVPQRSPSERPSVSSA